jgi:hypothetical protein
MGALREPSGDVRSGACFIDKLSDCGIGGDWHGAPLGVGGTASQYGRRPDTPMMSTTHSAAPTLEV